MIARMALGCAGALSPLPAAPFGATVPVGLVLLDVVMHPDNPAPARRNRHCHEGYWQGLPHRAEQRSVKDMAPTNGPQGNDLRQFLTTRRARISPEQSGLPVYGANRRVTGLRREEVALLAGISVEYYTRLER